jgi:hypothetical protein
MWKEAPRERTAVEFDMSPRRDHPELEAIGAYLDGRLASAERAAVEAHLADCGDCRELLGETAHALGAVPEALAAPLAEAPRDPPPPVSRVPRRRSWHLSARLALPLAAALAAAILAPWLLGRLRTPPPRVATLAGQLPPAPELVTELWQRGIYRGSAGSVGRLDRRSTLAGVLLLDARVALAAGDRARAILVTSRLAALLEDIGQVRAEAGRLREVAERLERGDAPDELVARIDEVEPMLEERLLPGWLDLGRWAEAGRLAAARRSAEYFRSRPTRVRLERLRAPAAGLDGETVAALAELAAFCESPPAADPEWAALATRLDALLIHSTP